MQHHPRVSAEFPTVALPWHLLRAPVELLGSQGLHRLPLPMKIVSANNDLDAIAHWLSTHDCEWATRIYQSSVTKLVNWAWLCRGKAVSSLEFSDFKDYSTFLARPEPREMWLSGRVSQTDLSWRPFRSGLSMKQITAEMACVQALVKWLGEVGYAHLHFTRRTAHFPPPKLFRGLRTIPVGKRPGPSQLVLGDVSVIWNAINHSNYELRERIKLVFLLQYCCGLTVADMWRADICDLETRHDGIWLLNIAKRDRNSRQIVLLSPVRDALRTYLNRLGNPRFGRLLQFSAASMYNDMHIAFQGAAESCDDSTEEGRTLKARLLDLPLTAARYAFGRHSLEIRAYEEAWQMIAARFKSFDAMDREGVELTVRATVTTEAYVNATKKLSLLLNVFTKDEETASEAQSIASNASSPLAKYSPENNSRIYHTTTKDAALSVTATLRKRAAQVPSRHSGIALQELLALQARHADVVRRISLVRAERARALATARALMIQYQLSLDEVRS